MVRKNMEGAGRQHAAQGPEPAFTGWGHPDYSDRHERVFQALVAAQQRHEGMPVYLDEIARTARLPAEETRGLLHDLTQVHRRVTELAGGDEPDLGPRFGIAPRL